MANYHVTPPARRQLLGRLQRLVRKELREIFRDRRTIITLVVMPVLIYPLLAVVFQRLLLTSLSPNVEPVYVLAVESELDQKVVMSQLQAGQNELARRARATGETEGEAA